MAKLQSTTSPQIFQFKITLIDSKPSIWPQLLVTDKMMLYQLHQIIQIATGWTNSHLHLFDIDGELYSLPEFELDDWSEPIRIRTLILMQVESGAPGRLNEWSQMPNCCDPHSRRRNSSY